MRNLRLLAIILPCLLLAIACAGNIKTVKLMDNDPEHIWLQHVVGDDDQIVPQNYDHPAKLSKKQLKAILEAAEFEEFILFSWKNRGRVFIDSEVEKLLDPLHDALTQAQPHQWVHFAVTGRKRDMLSITATPHLTDGVCFVQEGKFHLVIGNLNFELINRDLEVWRHDPRDHFYFDSIRLHVDPERGISKPPVIKEDKWLRKPRVNWLVFEPDTLLAATTPEETPEPATPSTVEERLKKLKELYEQGLINEEEYNNKRREILEDL